MINEYLFVPFKDGSKTKQYYHPALLISAFGITAFGGYTWRNRRFLSGYTWINLRLILDVSRRAPKVLHVYSPFYEVWVNIPSELREQS
jgi:hypothetical protein